MSFWFLAFMSLLNFCAALALVADGKWALATCYLCYAVATIAMTKV